MPLALPEYVKTELLNPIRKPLVRILWLDWSERVIGEYPAYAISGNVNFDASQDVRRTFSLTLQNAEGLFIPWGSNVNMKVKVKLMSGVYTPQGEYYWNRGVYVISSPTAIHQAASYEVQLQGTDKWSLLNGQLGGTLTDTYKIPRGTKVEYAIRKLAELAGEFKFNFDPCDVVTPYEMIKEPGSTIADMIKELALIASWSIYYDINGYLRFCPIENSELKDPVISLAKNSEFRKFLISSNYTPAWADVRNHFKVFGYQGKSAITFLSENFETGDIYEWTQSGSATLTIHNWATPDDHGPYCAYYQCPTTGYVEKKFFKTYNESGEIYLSCKPTANNKQIRFKLIDDADNGFYIIFDSDGYIKYYNGANTNLQTYSPDTWYDIKCSVDWPTRKVSLITVNAVSKGSDLAMKGTVNQLTRLVIDGTNSSYIDELLAQSVQLNLNYSGEAMDLDPSSPTNISTPPAGIGLKSAIVSDSNIWDNDLCRIRAEYELKQNLQKIHKSSHNIIPLPFLLEGDAIILEDEEAGLPLDKYEITRINEPLTLGDAEIEVWRITDMSTPVDYAHTSDSQADWELWQHNGVDIFSTPGSVVLGKDLDLYKNFGGTASWGEGTLINMITGQQDLILYDDFDSGVDGWVIYGSGEIAPYSDGFYNVLRKKTAGDPNGGYKLLTKPVSDYELVAFVRRVTYSGSNANRISLLDSNGNGYGICHDVGTLSIDVRSNWTPTTQGSVSTGLSQSPGTWYTMRLIKLGASVTAELHAGRTFNFSTPIASTTITNTTYSGAFDRIAVLGGYIYDVGLLKLSEFTGSIQTFSRSSIAYESDGTQVAANVPRYEDGKKVYTEDTQADFASGTLTQVQALASGDLVLAQEGTNYFKAETTQADFQAGTLTNVVATSAGDLELQTVAAPTFSRSSVAYLSDGTQVAANVPRFEPGRFGQAVMVEEGTTNLLTANQSSFEADPTGWDTTQTGSATASLTRDTSVAWMGTASSKLSNSGTGSGDISMRTYANPINVTAGQTYTFSVYVRNPFPSRYIRVLINWYQANKTFISQSNQTYMLPNSSWNRLMVTGTAPANAALAAVYVTMMAADPNEYINVDGAQFEQKSYYATTWTLGGTTRSPETLTVPTAEVLHPQEGTVDCWFILPSIPQDADILADTADAWEGRIWLPFLTGGWPRIQVYTSNEDVLDYEIPWQYLNTWVYLVVTWNGSVKKVYFNGQLVASKTYTGTFNVTTPQFKIGANLNSLIGDFRISSRARTDEEIAAAYASGQPLPVDADTTYKLAFDNSLVASKGGNRVSPSIDLSSVGTAANSTISWNATLPANTSLTVETSLSLDGGVTWQGWQVCTNGGAIPGITKGTNLSNARLQVRQTLSTTDTTVTPQLHDLTISVTSAYKTSGNRLSPSVPVGLPGLAQSSQITWVADTPTGTSLSVEISWDGGTTWLACTNGGALPGIAGRALSSASFKLRESLSTTDIAVTPALHSLTVTIQSNFSQMVEEMNSWIECTSELPGSFEYTLDLTQAGISDGASKIKWKSLGSPVVKTELIVDTVSQGEKIVASDSSIPDIINGLDLSKAKLKLKIECNPGDKISDLDLYVGSQNNLKRSGWIRRLFNVAQVKKEVGSLVSWTAPFISGTYIQVQSRTTFDKIDYSDYINCVSGAEIPSDYDDYIEFLITLSRPGSSQSPELQQFHFEYTAAPPIEY